MLIKPNSKRDERERIREEFWPNEVAWTGENRSGWFRAPRTLPMLVALLNSKGLNEKGSDLSLTYLALWSRHYDSGVIEITNETEAAYDAGYTSTRAVRTWQERMALLEELGFIKSKKVDNQRFRFVLLIDPGYAVLALVKKGLVDSDWLASYKARRIKNKERTPVPAAPSVPETETKNVAEVATSGKSAARAVKRAKKSAKTAS